MATGTDCQNTNTPAVEMTLEDFDASVFRLINQRRAAHGRTVLRPNGLLTRAASDYAASMEQGRFFLTLRRLLRPPDRRHSHLAAPAGRLHPAPPRLDRRRNLHWTTVEHSTPSEVIEAWMNRPEHRKYLLKRRFRDLGVAALLGTLHDPAQADGITVASEYGFQDS